jgi:predicted PurR-regulated permease PerM
MDATTIIILFALAAWGVVIILERVARKRHPERWEEFDRAKAESKSKTEAASGVSQNQATFGFVTCILIYALIGLLWGQLAGLIFGIVVGLVIAFLSSLIAELASKKGRSFLAFFWLSVFVSPVLMAIIAAALGPVTSTSPGIVSAPKVGEGITDRIRSLGELRDQGLITKSEFETKKKDLLDRL